MDILTEEPGMEIPEPDDTGQSNTTKKRRRRKPSEPVVKEYTVADLAAEAVVGAAVRVSDGDYRPSKGEDLQLRKSYNDLADKRGWNKPAPAEITALVLTFAMGAKAVQTNPGKSKLRAFFGSFWNRKPSSNKKGGIFSWFRGNKSAQADNGDERVGENNSGEGDSVEVPQTGQESPRNGHL